MTLEEDPIEIRPTQPVPAQGINGVANSIIAMVKCIILYVYVIYKLCYRCLIRLDVDTTFTIWISFTGTLEVFTVKNTFGTRSRHMVVCCSTQEAVTAHREYIDRKTMNVIFTPI